MVIDSGERPAIAVAALVLEIGHTLLYCKTPQCYCVSCAMKLLSRGILLVLETIVMACSVRRTGSSAPTMQHKEELESLKV